MLQSYHFSLTQEHAKRWKEIFRTSNKCNSYHIMLLDNEISCILLYVYPRKALCAELNILNTDKDVWRHWSIKINVIFSGKGSKRWNYGESNACTWRTIKDFTWGWGWGVLCF